MGKMAPLIGSSATEQLFLTRFAELCSSPTFATRQVCAANFGDFCAVIGSACAETILVIILFLTNAIFISNYAI